MKRPYCKGGKHSIQLSKFCQLANFGFVYMRLEFRANAHIPKKQRQTTTEELKIHLHMHRYSIFLGSYLHEITQKISTIEHLHCFEIEYRSRVPINLYTRMLR